MTTEDWLDPLLIDNKFFREPDNHLLSVIADWHEEQGLNSIANVIRWMRDNNKRPRAWSWDEPQGTSWWRAGSFYDDLEPKLYDYLYRSTDKHRESPNNVNVKVIAWYPTYTEAIQDLAQALERYETK